MQDRISPLLISVLCIGIAILYMPMLVLIGYSFNASALVSVWGGFSTSWYAQLLHNRPDPRCGVAVAARSASWSRPARWSSARSAAIALVRFRQFRGRLLLTGMVNAPLVMPEIITGITQLLLFVSMLQLFGWPHRGFTTIVIAHVAFCTAYVTITVQSRLHTRRPLARRGGHGPGRRPGARVHATPRCRSSRRRWLELAAQLHAVAR